MKILIQLYNLSEINQLTIRKIRMIQTQTYNSMTMTLSQIPKTKSIKSMIRRSIHNNNLITKFH